MTDELPVADSTPPRREEVEPWKWRRMGGLGFHPGSGKQGPGPTGRHRQHESGARVRWASPDPKWRKLAGRADRPAGCAARLGLNSPPSAPNW